MLCYHPLVRSNSLSRILDVLPCHCANDLIADGNRPYKQLATKKSAQNPNYWGQAQSRAVREL